MRYTIAMLLITLSGCYSVSPPNEDNNTQAAESSHKLAEVYQICQVLSDFHDQNNKWPSTYDELASFSDQISFTIPLWFQEQHRGRCFKSSDDGSLYMEFAIKSRDAEGNDHVCTLPVTLSKGDSQLDESAMIEKLKREVQHEH